jgi:hypothetical protein
MTLIYCQTFALANPPAAIQATGMEERLNCLEKRGRSDVIDYAACAEFVPARANAQLISRQTKDVEESPRESYLIASSGTIRQ